MKTLTRFLTVIFLAGFVAASLQIVAAVPPAITFSGMITLSVVQSLIPKPQGAVFFFALQRELWTGELIKGFRHANTFLSRIGKKDQYVKNNVIHLAQIGVDPAVLINNSTYPIPSAARADADIPIGLDKLETENTIITDDELLAIPYDKPGSVIEQHRESLEQKAAEKSIHSLCPLTDTSNTPVLFTSGDATGYTYNRKRLTNNDIIRMKKALDDLKVPLDGRELVLCNQHVEDLLMTSQAFKEQWYKRKTGEILDMFGFKISQFVTNPLFSSTNSQKKAFGSAAAAGTDLETSVVYYNKRAVQARGIVKMYHAQAEDNPQYRQSVIGFRLYHICLPKKDTGFGAIVSTLVV
ncbi:MAG: hypothetical protein QM503_04570 [Bacteroidota bacterium]